MVETPHCPHTDSRFEGRDPSNLLAHQRPEENQFSLFARPWLRRAEQSADRENWFEALIYLWVSFNAWLGLAVQDRNRSENDSYLWKAAGLDPLFQQRFSQSFESINVYQDLVRGFHALWPVFKARALADEEVAAWGASGAEESRDQYRAQVFAHQLDRRDYSPSCFLDHQVNRSDLQSIEPERVPLDWEHTLAAIYMVRCNLFHGGKSFLSAKDQDFVSHSYRILSEVWWGAVRDA